MVRALVDQCDGRVVEYNQWLSCDFQILSYLQIVKITVSLCMCRFSSHSLAYSQVTTVWFPKVRLLAVDWTMDCVRYCPTPSLAYHNPPNLGSSRSAVRRGTWSSLASLGLNNSACDWPAPIILLRLLLTSFSETSFISFVIVENYWYLCV